MKIFILTLAIASFSMSLKAKDFQITITNNASSEIHYAGSAGFGKHFHGKLSSEASFTVTAEDKVAISTSVSFSWKKNPNEKDTTCFMKKTGYISVIGDPKQNDNPHAYMSYNNSTWTKCI